MTLWAPNFNGAEIMRAGMALVPDLAGQQMQRRNLELQADALRLQQQQEARQLTEANRKFQRQQDFQQRYEIAAQSGRPGAVADLMGRFPEYSEAIKRQYDTLSDEKKSKDLGAYGELYSLGLNGRTDRIAQILQTRVDAEKAAGIADPDDAELLELFKSGDPEQRNDALGKIEGMLFSVLGAERFASAFGLFHPEKTTFEKESDYLASKDGEAAAANYRLNKSDPVVVGQPGAPVYRSSQFNQGGSGTAPATGAEQPKPAANALPARKPVANAGTIARSLFPDVEVTQVRRNPNSALGKKNPKSWHNRTGAAVDVAPIPGLTFDQYVQRYKDAGYTILEQRDEVKSPSRHATGPHWHIVLGGGPAPEKGPVRISTRQQYAKLASGTTYVAPDGTTRVKP